MRPIVCFVAVVLGGAIAWVDSRPGWDDTGVTVALLVMSSATLGAVAPERPWLTGLMVGAWLPLVEIARDGNYGTLLALAFALAGAYLGAGARRLLSLGAA